MNMIYQEGYVYHIKDEYFEKVQDSNLMQNKEGGTYRPTFYCLRDNKTSLLWMVPLSSRVEKFKAIHDKQMAKYGKCLTIVLGEFDGKEAAFLLQNMFPIRDYYLDHIHTRNNNPVPVKHSIHKEVTTRMKKIRQLHSRGKKVVFPDIELFVYPMFIPPYLICHVTASIQPSTSQVLAIQGALHFQEGIHLHWKCRRR